jgi:hypothetical protein
MLCGRDAAESELGENRARLGEGDGRVAADGDTPILVFHEEGLGAALADADGECARLERGIPEVGLPA